jgi:hypothetical protein
VLNIKAKMKKVVILCLVCFIALQCHAQQSASSPYGDNYSAGYYAPVMYGPNGFRTVDEENRLMTEALAERRRRYQNEESSEAEIARAVKKREQEDAENKRMFGANKKEDPKAKK